MTLTDSKPVMLEEEKLEEIKERLKEAFSDYYEAAGGWEFRYHHLLRTRRYAIKLMDAEELEKNEFDSTVVEVSALLHDLGRKEDIEEGFLDPIANHEGHAEKGSKLIEEFVSDLIEPEKLESIKKVIRNHHSEPETIEGKIVQDADDLGKFSSIDLWRLIHYASDNERTLDETFNYFKNELEPENRELIEELNLRKSKKAAKKRLENYSQTMKQMEKEALGEDIK